ncbi:hypothetical protein SFRURICE_014126, partial [Spodoptera frugiperda]
MQFIIPICNVTPFNTKVVGRDTVLLLKNSRETEKKNSNSLSDRESNPIPLVRQSHLGPLNQRGSHSPSQPEQELLGSSDVRLAEVRCADLDSGHLIHHVQLLLQERQQLIRHKSYNITCITLDLLVQPTSTVSEPTCSSRRHPFTSMTCGPAIGPIDHYVGNGATQPTAPPTVEHLGMHDVSVHAA